MEFAPINIRKRINWNNYDIHKAESFAMKAVIIRSLLRFGWSVDKINKVDFMLRLVDDNTMSYFKENTEYEFINFVAFDKGFCIHVFAGGDDEYANARLRVMSDFRTIDTPSELCNLVAQIKADKATYPIDEALAELEKMQTIDMFDAVNYKHVLKDYDMLKDGNIP